MSPTPVDPGEHWFADLIETVPLSAAQQRVADAMANDPGQAAYSDVAEMARRVGVDPSTVVRTAQSLGFSGWKDLQRELRARYLVRLSTAKTLEQHRHPRTPLHESLSLDMDSLRQTSEANSPRRVEEAIEILAAASSILVISLGSFSGPAAVFTHLAATMGYRARAEDRAGAHLATAMNQFSEDDVLLVFNPWRVHRHILTAATTAKNAGAKVVLITDRRRSALTALADSVLIAPSEGLSFFQSVTAATSVVYGLLAGMVRAHPERSEAVIRRTQRLWEEQDTYLD